MALFKFSLTSFQTFKTSYRYYKYTIMHGPSIMGRVWYVYYFDLQTLYPLGRDDIEERGGSGWMQVARNRKEWKDLWRPPASIGMTG